MLRRALTPIGFAAFLAALTPAAAWADLVWKEREISRTAGPGQDEVIAEFSFANKGAQPVTIREVQTGCECTVAELPKRAYAPGESGVIKVVFTLGDRMGVQTRIITFLTDDPAAPLSTVTLRVEIPELLTCSTRMAHWRVGAPAEEKSVEVVATGDNRVVELELRDDPANRTETRVATIEQGTRYRLYLKPSATNAPSTSGLTFLARFADGSERSFVIYVLVR